MLELGNVAPNANYEILRLWQKSPALPASATICDKGFLK